MFLAVETTSFREIVLRPVGGVMKMLRSKLSQSQAGGAAS